MNPIFGILRTAFWFAERTLEILVTALAGLLIFGPNNLVQSKDDFIHQVIQNSRYILFFEATSPFLLVAIAVLAFVEKSRLSYCLIMTVSAAVSVVFFVSTSSFDSAALTPVFVVFVVSVLVFSFLGQTAFELVTRSRKQG